VSQFKGPIGELGGGGSTFLPWFGFGLALINPHANHHSRPNHKPLITVPSSSLGLTAPEARLASSAAKSAIPRSPPIMVPAPAPTPALLSYATLRAPTPCATPRQGVKRGLEEHEVCEEEAQGFRGV
jgi:hypothetical protein